MSADEENDWGWLSDRGISPSTQSPIQLLIIIISVFQEDLLADRSQNCCIAEEPDGRVHWLMHDHNTIFITIKSAEHRRRVLIWFSISRPPNAADTHMQLIRENPINICQKIGEGRGGEEPCRGTVNSPLQFQSPSVLHGPLLLLATWRIFCH